MGNKNQIVGLKFMLFYEWSLVNLKYLENYKIDKFLWSNST